MAGRGIHGIGGKFGTGENVPRSHPQEIVRRKDPGRIASVELVPYHTKNFGNKANLRIKFGVAKEVEPIVKKAIERGAVILCPYYGAVDMWLKNVPALARHEYFYTTDETDIKLFPPGSLNINRLRRYSKIGSTRTDGENCEPLFDQLKKLGWKRIKQ